MQWTTTSYEGRRHSDEDIPPFRPTSGDAGPSTSSSSAQPCDASARQQLPSLDLAAATLGSSLPQKAASTSPVHSQRWMPHTATRFTGAAAPSSSLVYSTWDLRQSPIAFSPPSLGAIDTKGKGKERAVDQASSLSPAPPSGSPPAPSSVNLDSGPEYLDDGDDNESSSNETTSSTGNRPPVLVEPIRIRRVGALGISVASSSSAEEEDASGHRRRYSSRTHCDSRQKRNLKHENGRSKFHDEHSMSAKAPGRNLWEASDDDGKGNSRAESDMENVQHDEIRRRRSKRRPPAVADDSFRSIVDDLTLENQALKAKIRRLEGARLPSHIKKERLFEVRYFDALPTNRRQELAGFLTRYVQRIGAPTNQHAPMTPNDPFRAIRPGQSPADRPGETSLPRLLTLGKVSAPLTSSPAVSELAPPEIPDRKIKRHRSRRSERDVLAGPSNSGVEPQSLTGTGSGIKLDDASPPENDSEPVLDRPAKRVKIDPARARETSSARLIQLDDADLPKALELVQVIEKLFSDSIGVPGHPASPSVTKEGTNESYLGHLLENDDLHGGWTYLNLVCTMAQVHRFNVTLPFIQTAIKALSGNLEISSNGTKIRWIGPKRDSPKRQSETAGGEIPSGAGGDAGSADSASSGRKGDGKAKSRASSTTGESTSDFTFGSTTYSGTGGAASTAATSGAPPSAEHGHPRTSVQPPKRSDLLRPRRPLAGVLQRKASGSRHKSKSSKPSRSQTAISLAAATANSAADTPKSSDKPAVNLEHSLVRDSQDLGDTTSGHRPAFDSSQAQPHDSMQYVSVLNSRQLERSGPRANSDSTTASASTDSDDTDETEGGRETNKMIFYAEAAFCTDLSKEAPGDPSSATQVDLPFAPLGASGNLSQWKGQTAHLEETTEDQNMTSLEDVDILAIDVGAARPHMARTPSSSSEELESGLESYRVTGMNDTRSRDLFTIVVTTAYPQIDESHLAQQAQAQAKVSNYPPVVGMLGLGERKKQSLGKGYKILSTEVLHHSPLQPPIRRPLLLSSSSYESSHQTSSTEPNDTSSSDHPRGPGQLRTPSPDYLLSLGLPFFSWAPRTRPGGVMGAGAPLWRATKPGSGVSGSAPKPTSLGSGAQQPKTASQVLHPGMAREKQPDAPPMRSFVNGRFHLVQEQEKDGGDESMLSEGESPSEGGMPIDLDESVNTIL